MKRKICVITGSRSDYGPLLPLIKSIKNERTLRLQLVATGMHLSPDHGLTYKEIEKDGFHIDEKVKILTETDTADGTSKAMGLAMAGFTRAYKRLKPDIIVVLGDRFEIFSAVACALVHKIPVAHLCGGEVTKGAFDDAFRHSITKMSHLHFTATEEYRKRVIQLGEHPDRIFNVGDIGLDNIISLPLLSKQMLEKSLGLIFQKRNLLITFHPVTLDEESSESQFSKVLKALGELDDTLLIFTKANADPSGKAINIMIDRFVRNNRSKSVVFTSLGQLKYLSLMRYVDALVGNSSSGIAEAPSFKIGTINIGDRQTGRIKAKSVIDCEPDKNSILKALNILYSKPFQNQLKTVTNRYGDGRSAKRVLNVLKHYPLKDILRKEFFDMKTVL
jgi:GDP/UDP-N,N'-diacetylbacillosamine 2-epimerase (hydrolysing)